jgi:hypothetical protein
MLRYARFHLGDGRNADGEQLLSADGLRAMHSPVVPAGNFSEFTGIAWMLRTVGGTRLVEHGGGTNGQTSTLQLVPDRDFALVILTNSGDAAHGEIARWARKHYLDLDEPERTPLPMSPDALEPFVGRYDTALTAVELTLKDGSLVAQPISKGGFPTRDSPPRPAPPPTRVAFFAKDHIVALDPPLAPAVAEFLRAPDGQIAWLRWGGRIAARQS